MPFKPRRKEAAQDDNKTIEINAEMQGTLTFNDPVNLKINGRFVGQLETKGTLSVGDNAYVQANILGDNIVISGKVKGDISANTMLTLMPTAVLDGNIIAPKINIVEGAIFQGFCQMKEALLNIDDVAKYLEIDIDEINQLVNSGKIPGQKSGDAWKFERSKIDDWASSAQLNG